MKKIDILLILLMIILSLSVLVNNNNILLDDEHKNEDESEIFVNSPIRTKTLTHMEDFTDPFRYNYGINDSVEATTAYINSTKGQVSLYHREPIYQGSYYSNAAYETEIVGNYAYIVNGTGLEIVDISDPNNPTLVSYVLVDTSTESYYQNADQLAVYGNFAYVGADDRKIHIIDISNPTAPSPVYNSNASSPSINFQDIAVYGDYLYTVDTTDPGLHVYTGASNPSTAFDNTADASFDWYPSGSDQGIDIMVDESNLVHVVEQSGAGLGYQQISVSDPLHPTQAPGGGGEVMNCSVAGTSHIWADATDGWLDNYVYSSTTGSFSVIDAGGGSSVVASASNTTASSFSDYSEYAYEYRDLTEYNDMVYLTSNDYVDPNGDGNLFLYDVKNRYSNPQFITKLSSAYQGSGRDVRYANGYLYVSSYEGLHIFEDLGYTAYTTEYMPSATIESEYIYYTSVNTNIENATLTVGDSQPSGTNIDYYMSLDDGKHWEQVTPGVSHTFIYNEAQDYLKWKAVLTVTDNSTTPTIDWVNIEYFNQITDTADLLAPTNNTASTDTTPTFTWGYVSGCAGGDYQFQLDKVSTFDSGDLRIYNNTGNYETGEYSHTIQAGSELSEGTWYWRVAGLDSAGDIGYWSDLGVVHIDLTNPSIDSPSNAYYAEGTTGHSITWHPLDPHPAYYNMTRNGVDVQNGDWDGSSITIDIDGLAYGSYTYVCTVYDESGHYVTDEVLVSVYDAENPVIDSPTNQTIEQGTNTTLTWNPADNNPDWYNVTRNGTLMDEGNWDGSSISYTTDSDLTDGHYVYQCFVYDVDGNTASDIIGITIRDTLPPSFGTTEDLTYEKGSTGNEIVWYPSDWNPWYYNITLDGTHIEDGLWYGGPISINVDGHDLGSYNYSCFVTDSFDLTSKDTVNVTVIDTTAPIIQDPSDVSFENGTTNKPSITWVASDANPSWYNITVGPSEGQLLEWGTWNGSDIVLDLNDWIFEEGTHIINCNVYDTEGYTSQSSIQLEVYTQAPGIDSPADVRFPQGTTGHWINWTATDVSPDNYTIYYNGTVVDTGLWQSGVPINYSLDSLGLLEGTYNFTIVVEDTNGLQTSDLVWVEIANWPQITQYTGNLTVGIEEYFIIYWNMTDDNPISAIGYINGTYIDEQTWSSGDWPYEGTLWLEYPSGLPNPGLYNFTITVEDNDGLISVDTVWVTVGDMDPPTIDSPSDLEYVEGQTNNVITWNPTDSYPESYEVWWNQTSYTQGSWDGNSIGVNVDGLAVGVHYFNCTVTDQGGNTVYDVVVVTVLANIGPTLEVPDDMILQPGEGYDLTLNVTIQGSSLDWYLYRNGSLYDQDYVVNSWAEISLYDATGINTVGNYNWTLYVEDDLGNTAATTFWMQVMDTVPPQINVDPEQYIEYNYGSQEYYIQFEVTDDFPDQYAILVDGDEIDGDYWTSGVYIVVNVGGLTVGEHNVTAVFYDQSGNSAVFPMTVNVVDNEYPTISASQDQFSIPQGTSGYEISWECGDNAPANYSITLDGDDVVFSDWDGSDIYYIIPADLALGDHVIECTVIDQAGNMASSEVEVIITVALTIDAPADQTITDQDETSIVWHPEGIPPVEYEITVNGELKDSGVWGTQGSSITYNFGPVSAGEYQVTINLEDSNGITASDTVYIYVEPSEDTGDGNGDGEFSPSFIFPLTVLSLLGVAYIRIRRKH